MLVTVAIIATVAVMVIPGAGNDSRLRLAAADSEKTERYLALLASLR